MKRYNKVDIVFVDMDNTIAENKTCQNVRYYKGLYEEKRPIKVVIKAIKVDTKGVAYAEPEKIK